jgi:hypothetical protein
MQPSLPGEPTRRNIKAADLAAFAKVAEIVETETLLQEMVQRGDRVDPASAGLRRLWKSAASTCEPLAASGMLSIRRPTQGQEMQSKTGDPRLDALDELRAAMASIYDAKRAWTATARDDARLKELHVQWMAVMLKFG